MTSSISGFDVVSVGENHDTLPPSLARSLDSILKTLEDTYDVEAMNQLIKEFMLHAVDHTNPHHTAELFALYAGVLDMLYSAYKRSTRSPISRDEFATILFTWVDRITEEEQLADPLYQDHALGVRFLKVLVGGHDADPSVHPDLLAPLKPTVFVPDPTFHMEPNLTFGRLVKTDHGGENYLDSSDIQLTIPYYLNTVYPSISASRVDSDMVALSSIGIPSLYPMYATLEHLGVVPETGGTLYITGDLSELSADRHVSLLSLTHSDKACSLKIFREIGTKDQVTVEYRNNTTRQKASVATGRHMKLFITYAKDGFRLYWRPTNTLLRSIVPVSGGMTVTVDSMQIGVQLSSGAIQDHNTLSRITVYDSVLNQEQMLLIMDTDLQ